MKTPINRWMKLKRNNMPHFVLFREEDGCYHTACGRVHTPDMEELTTKELEIVRNDYYGNRVCRSCHYTHIRQELDPFSYKNQNRMPPEEPEEMDRLLELEAQVHKQEERKSLILYRLQGTPADDPLWGRILQLLEET